MAKKQSKAQKVWSVILNVILGILILIGLLVLFSLLPFKGNYKLYSVMSGSMSPTIKTGAMVLIKPMSDYKKDDIITYQSGTRKLDVTTHRIVDIENIDGINQYTVKGDANKTADYTKIPEDKIVGKVIGHVGILGYILGYIKTLPGLLIIIIIPAVIIIYEEIKKVKEEMTKIIRKKKAEKKSKNNNKKSSPSVAKAKEGKNPKQDRRKND